MSQPNYYALLRIGRNATTQEVTQAYHKLAKKLHPDLQRVSCPKKEEELKACTAAYNVLRDETERRKYDRSLGFTSAARREDFEGRFTLYRRRAQTQAQTRRAAGAGGGGGGSADSRAHNDHEQRVMFNHNLHQQAHYPPKHILAWQERQQEQRARDKAEHTNDAEAMRHRTYFRRAESRHQAAAQRAAPDFNSGGCDADRDKRDAWAEADERHGRKPSDGDPPCCVM